MHPGKAQTKVAGRIRRKELSGSVQSLSKFQQTGNNEKNFVGKTLVYCSARTCDSPSPYRFKMLQTVLFNEIKLSRMQRTLFGYKTCCERVRCQTVFALWIQLWTTPPLLKVTWLLACLQFPGLKILKRGQRVGSWTSQRGVLMLGAFCRFLGALISRVLSERGRGSSALSHPE